MCTVSLETSMVSLLHSGHLRAVDFAPRRAALLPSWEGSMGAVRKTRGQWDTVHGQTIILWEEKWRPVGSLF